MIASHLPHNAVTWVTWSVNGFFFLFFSKLEGHPSLIQFYQTFPINFFWPIKNEICHFVS